MEYYKIIDAGDFQTYSEQFMLYYYTHKNNFIPRNRFWNPLKTECLENCSRYNPALFEGISKFGTIKQMAILFLFDDSATLHIDHKNGLNENVKARLNIPLLNCSGSFTAFFEMNESTFGLGELTESTKILVWPTEIRNTLKPVCEVELIQPTILRTSSPHTVFCRTCNFPRVSLTISFENDVANYLSE